MFCRRDGADLLVTAGDGEPVFRVPVDGFTTVSAIRWCEERGELIATAVPAGGAVPAAHTGERDASRLHRCDPRDGVWHQLYRGFAHDPVRLPGGTYVVHRGAGLTVLDDRGTVVREVKEGRFSGRPPALSAGPDGARVGWIRWAGDRGTLCADGPGPGTAMRYRTAADRYAWLDPGTLIYIHGARPRLLDVPSGATRSFGAGLREQVRHGRVAGATAELAALAARPAAELWEFYGDVRVAGPDVWFSATLTEQRGRSRVDGCSGPASPARDSTW
jgi:hypothetical protein